MYYSPPYSTPEGSYVVSFVQRMTHRKFPQLAKWKRGHYIQSNDLDPLRDHFPARFPFQNNYSFIRCHLITIVIDTEILPVTEDKDSGAEGLLHVLLKSSRPQNLIGMVS